MTTVNIYLTFQGNCREAFEFYQSVFGGEFRDLSPFGDMPPMEGMPPLPEGMKDQLMHVSLPISNETALMGCDAGGEWAPAVTAGNNFSVSVNTDSQAEGDRIFGALTDAFGINWMVSFELAGASTDR